MPNPVYSVERAAVRAFASHLAAGLGPEVQVWDRWPDATARITDPQAAPGRPRATLTVLLVGDRIDVNINPVKSGERLIHDDVTPRVEPAAAITTVPTACAALEDCRTSYESSHRTDTGAHVTADTANTITAPTATNLATGIALVNQFRTVLTLHAASSAHDNADAGTAALRRLAAVASGDSAGLIAAAQVILDALNAHYAARIDQWTVALCDQSVQLDLWAAYEAERDSLRYRLEPLLRMSAVDPANGFADDPATSTCTVALGDGWQGYADFEIGAARTIDTPESIKAKEFRATYTGRCQVPLLVWAQSPRLVDITLNARLAASLGALDDTVAKSATLEPAGTTYSGG